jgi:hypothetical protein
MRREVDAQGGAEGKHRSHYALEVKLGHMFLTLMEIHQEYIDNSMIKHMYIPWGN